MQTEKPDQSKIFEIDVNKSGEEEPEIKIEKDKEVQTQAPPPPQTEMEKTYTDASDIYNMSRYERESNDIPTNKLWRRKDGSPLQEGDKISVKLNLLIEITDYLKLNEPKKTIGEKVVIKRPRRQTIISSEPKIKKVEKKPRKDCVCNLDKIENPKRKKLVHFLKVLGTLDEQKIDEIIESAHNLNPHLEFNILSDDIDDIPPVDEN